MAVEAESTRGFRPSAEAWTATGSAGTVASESDIARRTALFETEAVPHLQKLFSTACRLTGNRPDAEDLVQETYLRAFRALDSYTPGTNMRAWLYTILYRARTDSLRRAQRSPQTEPLGEEGSACAPEQERALTSGGEEIGRALARVPEVFRSAVVLRDVQEFSYEEIARILDVPIGTVMSRIHRGRALLRRTLGGGPRS